MTSVVRSIGLAGGILVLAGVQSASAQVTGTLEFATPFPFTVGNTTVPAGKYTIKPDDDNPQILQLSGAHTSVLLETENAQAPRTPSKSEVVFKRYGDAYVLKNVWLEGSDSGAETLPVEAERHAAKHQGAESEQRVAARKTVETAKNR